MGPTYCGGRICQVRLIIKLLGETHVLTDYTKASSNVTMYKTFLQLNFANVERVKEKGGQINQLINFFCGPATRKFPIYRLRKNINFIFVNT